MCNEKSILFEPWNLGDAIIAFATALQDPERIALACSSRWHPLLRCAAQESALPTLIAVDLGYVSRNKHSERPQALSEDIIGGATILSIRGDLRDYRAARALFPGCSLRMSGWVPFLAKRSALVDYVFAREWIPVRNRYKAWADMADVEWERILRFYQRRREVGSSSVVIHVGAQWRSKQFPHAADLVRLLGRMCRVRIIAGPRDPLPEAISESDVERLVDGELVRALASSTHVVANDSGPMHLAALLGCQTLVLSNRAAMREWLPPGVISIEPRGSKQGYNAPRLSDEGLDGWPSADEVAGCLRSSLSQTEAIEAVATKT